MDANGCTRKAINKTFDFSVKQLQASYTVNGRVVEKRILILPKELVNSYALTQSEVIELILHKIIRGFETEEIFPEVLKTGPIDIKSKEDNSNNGGQCMTEFTYEIPNEEKFLQAVLVMIRKKGNNALASLLSGSKCSIIRSENFSRKRWNAYYTIVDFAFPSSKYDEIVNQIDVVSKEIIKEICNDVMPSKNGLAWMLWK